MNRRWISHGLLIGALTLGLLLLGGVALILPAVEAQAAPTACVPGPHSGDITADETWCLADSPHLITGTVVVLPSATLTIQEGVTVQTRSGAELQVRGRLRAVGTAAQRILFTSEADTGPGQWNGLYFNGGTGDLEYVVVRYAGPNNSDGYRGNIVARNVLNGELHIINSEIRDQMLYDYVDVGLNVNDSHVLVSNTLFTGNGGGVESYHDAPMRIIGAGSVVTMTANSFISNTHDQVLIYANAMTAHDVRLTPQTYLKGYRLVENYVVPSDITLTVDPGVTVFSEGGELQVQGHLNAIGTQAQPILFTSQTDTPPPGTGPGQWGGILFNGGMGDLRHVTVRYGGAGNSAGYGSNITAMNVQTGEVRISDSVIRDENNGDGGSDAGLWVVDSRVAVSNTLFTGNGSDYWSGHDAPMRITGAPSVVTMTANSFTGNIRDRVVLDPGAMMAADARLTSQTLLAGYEMWGGDFTVPPTVTLTIGPGVTVFNNGGELQVQGRLNAMGTATQPITLTGLSGTAAYPWRGLCFNGGAGDLRHVTVHYGSNGNSCGFVSNVAVQNGEARISDSVISDEGALYSADAGLFVWNSHVVVSNTLFTRNGGGYSTYDAGIRVGNHGVLTITGSALRSNFYHGMIINDGQVIADGVVVEDSSHGCHGVYMDSDQAVVTMTNSIIILNAGAGVHNGGQFMARSTVFADNRGNGLVVAPNARATLLHPTTARNGVNGVYVDNSGAVTMTNSIIAGNATGVRVVGSGQATLTNTLWDHNTTPTVGPVNETGHLEGLAQFALDGYHITRYSAALEQGVNAGVTDDLDAQARPLPAGTAPDLGADEYPYSLDTEFVAEKAAFAPQWIVDPAHPYGRLQQRYLIRYYYGSDEPDPPALTVSVTDTLPAGLAFQSEWHTPAMTFQPQGQQLAWQTTSPVQRGQSGQMQIVTVYDSPQPGRILTNTAEVRAGAFHFELQAATQVSVAAPLIVSLGNGDMCPGTVVISGTVPQVGVTVTLYANGSPVAQAPAVNGIFTATYNYPGGTVTLKAQACGMDGLCSAESNAVTLTPSQSFWCPQRSTWEGTPTAGPLAGQHLLVYQFRDNSGNFSTRDWVIPGVYGFWNTTLHLYACNCPPSSGVTDPPSSVWVIADGVRYDASSSPPWYTFAITGGAHSVRFYAQCGSNVVSSEGTVLIDPDGYIFDVTQGFDPLSPTLHAVSGVTVTAYVSMPQWGGWVPWPAHLYNNQINPQVTGEDGYFAFFTPPGDYYLQVEGKPGYQSWRSPVIQVVNEIVHVNVPLTPWTDEDVAQVTLDPAGPGPATLTVSEGTTVEWRAPWDNKAPPETQLALAENPTLHLLSARNPLSDTLGFDGGMLAPGRVYRRQFTTQGTYTYNDGLGHTATIVVGPPETKVYLPLVLRNR